MATGKRMATPSRHFCDINRSRILLRCPLFPLFVLLLLVTLPYVTVSSSTHQQARRCLAGWENESIDLVEDLRQSSCQPCSNFHGVQRNYLRHDDSSSEKNLPHVGVILPHNESPVLAENYLTAATVLVMKGHKVTLFINHLYMDGTVPHDLREYIQARVPCDAQLFASNLLHIEFIPIGTSRCMISWPTFDRMRCAIEEADTFVTDRFRSMLQQNAVGSLILEAGMIAGQLAANSLGIPVTALLDPDMYSDDLLVRRWVRLRSQSMRFVIDFWEDLEWTTSFSKYNKIRRRLGLPTVYAISDIWSSVSLVLTKPRETLKTQVSVVEGPLMTPCIPCNIQNPLDEYDHYKSRAILNVDSTSTNHKLQKDLLKALSMARESGKAWVSSCNREACPENLTELYDFGVIQISPVTEKYFPVFVAPLENDINLAEILGHVLSSGDEVVLILVDDKVLDTNPWLNDLGPPILEVDATASVRELAVTILKGLHGAHEPRLPVRTAKGLEPILAAMTTPGVHSDRADINTNYSINFMVMWLVGCLFLALCLSLGELESQGKSLSEGEVHTIIGNQFRDHWSDTEEIVRCWHKWLSEQWGGAPDGKQHAGVQNPTPHRRRKANKRKQT